MGIVLGPNQYGKAECRLLTVSREGGVHHIKDLSVGTSLRGDFAACHERGDNAHILPTDSQKNTVYAFAKDPGVGEIEDFALLLARHFVASSPHIHAAQVRIEQYPWNRVAITGAAAASPADGHPHTFCRGGDETRTTVVTVETPADGGAPVETVVSGLTGLVVLKSTGSEFRGFATDAYTTLEETDDRILATAVTAQWRHTRVDGIDWAAGYAATRAALIETFAVEHSRSLQQTLYDMGAAALRARPEIAEVRLSMPNRHHFAVDLSPFGLDNRGEVFFPADRPYGLIEGTVTRDGASTTGTPEGGWPSWSFSDR